jgi:excisionase family DNA binding protein
MLKTEVALVNFKEASELLGVSEATVLQLACEGRLPITPVVPTSRERILFLRDDLLRFEDQFFER